MRLIWRHDIKQSKVNPNLIWKDLCCPDLKAYWIKEGRYLKEAEDRIDWRALRRAMTFILTGQQ
jgi:hypothetical protein